jgi:Mg-chelatase subunit ChlD
VSRYDQACLELAKLQGDLPGKIGVISFSDKVMFCPNGTPFNFRGTTDLAGALKFAKVADVPGGMRFIVISDGMPDSPNEALKVAHTFANRIDVIYCGPESNPEGRDFLQRLAKASGGQTITADKAKELASSVQRLLAA